MRMPICCSPNRSDVPPTKAQKKSTERGKNGDECHILETIFTEARKKKLSDSSHTSRKVSVLSGYLFVSTGEPMVTEGKGRRFASI